MESQKKKQSRCAEPKSKVSVRQRISKEAREIAGDDKYQEAYVTQSHRFSGKDLLVPYPATAELAQITASLLASSKSCAEQDYDQLSKMAFKIWEASARTIEDRKLSFKEGFCDQSEKELWLALLNAPKPEAFPVKLDEMLKRVTKQVPASRMKSFRDFLRDLKKLDDFGNPISNYSEGEVLEIINRHSSITSQVQYLSIGRAFHVWLKEVRPRKQAKKAANTSWKKRKSGA